MAEAGKGNLRPRYRLRIHKLEEVREVACSRSKKVIGEFSMGPTSDPTTHVGRFSTLRLNLSVGKSGWWGAEMKINEVVDKGGIKLKQHGYGPPT